jgi:hypothetical protein
MRQFFNGVGFPLLLLFLCANGIAQTKDYSEKGPEFAPLKDIRLTASRVDSIGPHQISVEGFVLDASSYKVATKEPAPFIEGGRGYNNVIKDIDMQYELLVAEDTGNRVHAKLIAVLTEISRLPDAERDFTRVGLVGERGRYLIFSGPVTMPNYVWFDGRVIVVRWVGMKDKRRDRSPTTETFWKEKIRFFSGGKKVPLEGLSKAFAADFMKRLAAGEFNRPAQ